MMGIIIVFLLQGSCYGSSDNLGVPRRTCSERLYDVFFPSSHRVAYVYQAIAQHDAQQLRRYVRATDVLDYPDMVIAAVVGNDVQALRIMDDVTYRAHGYHLDLRAAYYHDQHHEQDLFVTALDAGAYDAALFLLDHGYRPYVGKVIRSLGKTPYQYVVHHRMTPVLDACMQAQADSNFWQIDSSAMVARGFVQTYCHDDVTTPQCMQSREFFAAYVTSLHRHGMTDHELLIDMVHHAAADHTESVVLEELISLMEALSCSWDVPNTQGNYPLHTAVQASNKKAVPVLIKKKASIDKANQQGQTPEAVAHTALQVCGQNAPFADEQIYIDSACKNAQETLKAYQDALAAHAAKKDNPDKELYGN